MVGYVDVYVGNWNSFNCRIFFSQAQVRLIAEFTIHEICRQSNKKTFGKRVAILGFMMCCNADGEATKAQRARSYTKKL